MRCPAILLLVMVPVQAVAGAWTLERGRTNAFVTSSFTYGDHGFDDDGRLVTVPEYRKFNLQGVVEHGVRDWLTAIAKGELREETVYETVSSGSILFDPTVSTTTVPMQRTYGSVAGGARVRLHKAPRWVVSAEALGSSGGFDTAGTAAASDSPAVEARALFGFGHQLFGRPVFVDAQAGYRARLSDDEPDEVLLDLTLGAQVLPRWMALAQTFSTFETSGGTHYHKASGSIVRKINDHLSVELSANATVYGRNALQEVGGKLGFWWSY